MLTIGGSNPNLSLPSGASFVPESMRNSLNRCASIFILQPKPVSLRRFQVQRCICYITWCCHIITSTKLLRPRLQNRTYVYFLGRIVSVTMAKINSSYCKDCMSSVAVSACKGFKIGGYSSSTNWLDLATGIIPIIFFPCRKLLTRLFHREVPPAFCKDVFTKKHRLRWNFYPPFLRLHCSLCVP